MMSLVEKINEEIKEAIRSRDQVRLSVLRMLKSKILAADARSELSDQEVLKLFKTYFGNLQEAFEQAQSANRPEIADQLKAEMVIVQEFLPKAPSLEETKRLVIQAIQESGAKTKKELGLVMKTLMRLNNSIDGKLAKEMASELLVDIDEG